MSRRSPDDRAVLALGSAVLEACDEGVLTAGGTALNVAVAARRLGARAHLVAAVAEDDAGAAVTAFATAEGVILHPAPGTRPTVVARPQREGTTAEYTFSSLTPSGTLTLGAPHLDLIRRVGVLVISGARADTPAALVDLIRAVADRTGPTIYDPNPRRRSSDDVHAHRHEIEQLAPFVDVLKLSEEDCDLVFGTSLDHVARWFLDRGTPAVLLTRGPKGAVLVTRQTRAEYVSLVKADAVVDPTGAGDAMTGAIAWWFSTKAGFRDHADLEAALVVARVTAALTCLRSGSAAALPHADELPPALLATLDRCDKSAAVSRPCEESMR